MGRCWRWEDTFSFYWMKTDIRHLSWQSSAFWFCTPSFRIVEVQRIDPSCSSETYVIHVVLICKISRKSLTTSCMRITVPRSLAVQWMVVKRSKYYDSPGKHMHEIDIVIVLQRCFIECRGYGKPKCSIEGRTIEKGRGEGKSRRNGGEIRWLTCTLLSLLASWNWTKGPTWDSRKESWAPEQGRSFA